MSRAGGIPVVYGEEDVKRFGALSREQVLAALTRTGPMARLTERAERRLRP